MCRTVNHLLAEGILLFRRQLMTWRQVVAPTLMQCYIRLPAVWSAASGVAMPNDSDAEKKVVVAIPIASAPSLTMASVFVAVVMEAISILSAAALSAESFAASTVTPSTKGRAMRPAMILNAMLSGRGGGRGRLYRSNKWRKNAIHVDFSWLLCCFLLLWWWCFVGFSGGSSSSSSCSRCCSSLCGCCM